MNPYPAGIATVAGGDGPYPLPAAPVIPPSPAVSIEGINAPAGVPRAAPVQGTAGNSNWDRPTPYDAHFDAADKKYGLPPGLTKAIAARESGFNPNARGTSGEIGLMQFMPGTAQRFKINPGDPAASIDAAGNYLRQNFEMFKSWDHAVGAYNAGEGNLQQVLAGRIALPAVTKDYVKTVISHLNSKYASLQPGDAQQRPADVGVKGTTLFVNGVTLDLEKDKGKAIELMQQGGFKLPGKGQLPPGFEPVEPERVEGYFKRIIPEGNAGKSWEQAKAGYFGNLGSAAGLVQQMFGVKPEDNSGYKYANEQKTYSGALGRMNGFTQEFKDVHSLADFAGYAVDKVIGSTPYLAEAFATAGLGSIAKNMGLRAVIAKATEAGVAKGLSVETASALARQVGEESLGFMRRYAPQIGLTIGGLPSSTGDIVSNMQDAAPPGVQPNAAAAIGLGIPYSLLNAVTGVGGAISRGAVGGITKGMAEMSGVGGRLVRGVGGLARTGAEEAFLNELPQEMLNQAGRGFVNPNETMFSPAAVGRYGEAIAGGATVGGVLGFAGGAMRGKAAPVDMLQGRIDPNNIMPDANAPGTSNITGGQFGVPPGFVGPDRGAVPVYGNQSPQGFGTADIGVPGVPESAFTPDMSGITVGQPMNLGQGVTLTPGTAAPGVAPQATGAINMSTADMYSPHGPQFIRTPTIAMPETGVTPTEAVITGDPTSPPLEDGSAAGFDPYKETLYRASVNDTATARIDAQKAKRAAAKAPKEKVGPEPSVIKPKSDAAIVPGAGKGTDVAADWRASQPKKPATLVKPRLNMDVIPKKFDIDLEVEDEKGNKATRTVNARTMFAKVEKDMGRWETLKQCLAK